MKLSFLARALVLGATLLPLMGLQPAPAAAAAGVPSVTDPRYFVGVNLPWFNYGCDFGCGAKSLAGSASMRSSLANSFGQLQGAGVHAVRWWTFEDVSQIQRDSSGAPSGLNPAVYADFDAALAMADKYDLAYDFVLFNGPASLPKSWLEDPGQRQKLADALAPLFERYKNNPHILAWEFFNEPEYDIWGGKVSQQSVQDTVKLLASTSHAHSNTAVTVGSADLEGVPMWMGLGLDFYSPHWYDHMDTGMACARCVDVPTLQSVYKVDSLPIVIGEFEAGTSDALQKYKDFRAKGYVGAWGWSLLSDHTADNLKIDLGAAKTFAANPGAAPAPSAPVQSAPTVQLQANWITPTYVAPGQQITVNQDVTSSDNETVQVDFEVYDSNGQKVAQSTLDNQSLAANAVSSFSTAITLPDGLPAGNYLVKTGVFAPDHSKTYAWTDTAGTFVVDGVAQPPPAQQDDATADSDATADAQP
jgi:hypothetical protein